jgi:CubicO group peptidase (beta-lactamase class C family)
MQNARGSAEAIRSATEELVDDAIGSGRESAVQVAVILDGDIVVDVSAGWADEATRSAVGSDSLFFAASTAKGIVSATTHCLLERGDLVEALRLSDVWPEFAAMGKQDVTLRHVLDHTAGVPAPPASTTVAELCDWEHMCGAIAASEPWWEPGTEFGYHAITFGFLVGETVRRATGRPLSSWLRELLTIPLGLEDHVYFGVPREHHRRVVPQIDSGPLPQPGPGTAAARALPEPMRPDAAYANDARVLSADIPSQGTMTALGAASVYAALLGHVAGLDVVSPERRERLPRLRCVGHDAVMDIDAAWADGFSPHAPGGDDVDRSVFGMFGVNGTGAYADPERGVAVAVMRNRFDPDASVLAGVDRIITDTLAPRA